MVMGSKKTVHCGSGQKKGRVVMQQGCIPNKGHVVMHQGCIPKKVGTTVVVQNPIPYNRRMVVHTLPIGFPTIITNPDFLLVATAIMLSLYVPLLSVLCFAAVAYRFMSETDNMPSSNMEIQDSKALAVAGEVGHNID